jgi:hypothetical protein
MASDETRERAERDIPGPQAAAAAIKTIGQLTGKQTLGVTSLEPTDTGWLVGVEVVEENRVPSSGDVLAVYQTDIGLDGDLLSYRRVRRYLRGNTGDESGVA